MSLFFEGLFLALMVFAAVPVLMLVVQVAGALHRARRPALQVAAPAPVPIGSIAVLMPAHDEADGIARTIRSVLPQLRAEDHLLVVADNCSDETAKCARDVGASVIERHDPQRRGKGYALAFGMQYLAALQPEVVIILDADCLASPGAIPLLARQATLRQTPIQAHYRMQLPADVTLMNKVSAFAWRFKTLVRPLGYLAFGLPSQLMGSGMAFPTHLLSRFDLGGSHLVEDLKLGLDMTCAGAAPRFEPGAEVISSLPPSAQGSRKQRTRWEHGHLGMLAKAPALFALARRKRSGMLLAAVADLCVPPLALLVLLLSAQSLMALGGFMLLGWLLPLLFISAVCLLFGLSILVAWWHFGRDVLTMGELAAIPFYVLWKIPIYIGFVFRRERAWVRTERGPSP
jgi:cellulose synthase/poly-beta-1,6-N-acetylglucosamine synthase-like glycosyltransferase